MPANARRFSWTPAYWLLTLLWPLVVLPLTYLAVSVLEVVFNSPHLADGQAYWPLLTQWYQGLGSSGLYALTASPVLLSVLLAPFRKHWLAVCVLGLVEIAAIYFAFGGVIAAHIAYVKMCI